MPHTLSSDPEFAFSTKIEKLLELSKLTIRTDSVRVITLSLHKNNGAIKVPGATDGWHPLSHHGDQLEHLRRIERDILKSLNDFLTKLDSMPKEDESLLDHTTVVISSNFGDASTYTCSKLHTIVVGGGHRQQVHTVPEKPTPLSNLWRNLWLELFHKHNNYLDQLGSIDDGSFLLRSLITRKPVELVNSARCWKNENRSKVALVKLILGIKLLNGEMRTKRGAVSDARNSIQNRTLGDPGSTP